ncbi:unnamed protein product [Amoebophrya sp. A120]|nr:unnamed protein product [Amoebophrya sp. A120]|eukprot:GSA120T00001394001.1
MEKYRRIRVLGKGSFGKAFLVENTAARKARGDGDVPVEELREEDIELCVVKQMETLQMTPKQRDEAVKEAAVLKRMTGHPNIVAFREVFLTRKGRLCIVMDYCDGGDVHQKIKQQNGVLLPEQQITDWFCQVCFALRHVHSRKVLHRDLKTQNIFLHANQHVKLGDFGISRVLDATKDYAKTMVGTPYYLSPEIIEDQPYNFQSDVWSLGVVLYEMTTLKHPFDAESLHFLAVKILNGKYPPPDARYCPELGRLIQAMLSKEPANRPSLLETIRSPALKTSIHAVNERYRLGWDLSLLTAPAVTAPSRGTSSCATILEEDSPGGGTCADVTGLDDDVVGDDDTVKQLPREQQPQRRSSAGTTTSARRGEDTCGGVDRSSSSSLRPPPADAATEARHGSRAAPVFDEDRSRATATATRTKKTTLGILDVRAEDDVEGSCAADDQTSGVGCRGSSGAEVVQQPGFELADRVRTGTQRLLSNIRSGAVQEDGDPGLDLQHDQRRRKNADGPASKESATTTAQQPATASTSRIQKSGVVSTKSTTTGGAGVVPLLPPRPPRPGDSGCTAAAANESVSSASFFPPRGESIKIGVEDASVAGCSAKGSCEDRRKRPSSSSTGRSCASSPCLSPSCSSSSRSKTVKPGEPNKPAATSQPQKSPSVSSSTSPLVLEVIPTKSSPRMFAPHEDYRGNNGVQEVNDGNGLVPEDMIHTNAPTTVSKTLLHRAQQAKELKLVQNSSPGSSTTGPRGPPEDVVVGGSSQRVVWNDPSKNVEVVGHPAQHLHGTSSAGEDLRIRSTKGEQHADLVQNQIVPARHDRSPTTSEVLREQVQDVDEEQRSSEEEEDESYEADFEEYEPDFEEESDEDSEDDNVVVRLSSTCTPKATGAAPTRSESRQVDERLDVDNSAASCNRPSSGPGDGGTHFLTGSSSTQHPSGASAKNADDIVDIARHHDAGINAPRARQSRSSGVDEEAPPELPQTDTARSGGVSSSSRDDQKTSTPAGEIMLTQSSSSSSSTSTYGGKAASLREYLISQVEEEAFREAYAMVRESGSTEELGASLQKRMLPILGKKRLGQLFPLFQLLCLLEDIGAS